VVSGSSTCSTRAPLDRVDEPPRLKFRNVTRISRIHAIGLGNIPVEKKKGDAMTEYIMPLLGGALIGLAASLMLFLNGRVTGISGIIYGATIAPEKGEISWRWCFISGMLLGGFILKVISPQAFAGILPTANWTLVVAGILVGFGTVLGSGCTSGHGVCGISRLSPRSLVATLTFMAAGIFAVVLFRNLNIYQ